MAHHDWTLDALIEAYKQHQRRTRGLREKTLLGYERYVRLFVRAALGGDPIDPRCFSPSEVIEFSASLRGRFSQASIKAVRGALPPHAGQHVVDAGEQHGPTDSSGVGGASRLSIDGGLRR